MRYKYSLIRLNKKKILVIDDSISNFIPRYDYSYFDTKIINLLELIKSLIIKPAIKRTNIKDNYFECVLKTISPKIIIFNHISYFNFNIKTNHRIKIIVFQHSFLYDFEIKYLKQIKCDYFLAINEQQKKLLTKKIDGEIIISGSISSNCKVKIPMRKKYDILIISEFRDHKTVFFGAHKEILKIINEYANKNNIKLGIAYNASRKDKKSKLNLTHEIQFFEKYIGIKDDTFLNSFEKAAQSELIICISSNIGLELISHYYKVLFINAFVLFDKKFRLPHFYDDEGLFWTKSMDKNKIFSMIENVLYMSKDEWISYLEKNNSELVTGNRNNKIFHNAINKCLQSFEC